MPSIPAKPSKLAIGAVVCLGLAALAIANRRQAQMAERAAPPQGGFLLVDEVKLHYVDQGHGPVVVLIHGNGSMIDDFTSSGLVDLLARDHRVIVFDRPGYGYSKRPHTWFWTAQAQGRLIARALDCLGVRKAVVLGHSWGASVAVALGLQSPDLVHGLVLTSGYYFAAEQKGLALMSKLLSGPALPVIGPLLRNTFAPVIVRALWPRILHRLFAPAPVPAKFAGFPRELAFRPSQINTSAAEAGMLTAMAASLQTHYRELSMPVAIVAGTDDRLIDSAAQSWRLYELIRGSTIHPVPRAGHMVHQTAPEVLDAILREISAKIVAPATALAAAPQHRSATVAPAS